MRYLKLLSLGTLALVMWTVEAAPAAEPQKLTVDSETAAKQKILDSQEWREMHDALEEWLSVQKTYTPDQVKRIREQFHEALPKMNAEQLQNLLDEMNEKLRILLGSEARQAREYMRQYLSVASKSKIAQMRKNLPDIIRDTPEQLKESLDSFEGRQASIKQTQAAFDQGREAKVKAAEEEMNRQREEYQEAQDRLAEEGSDGWGGYGGGGGGRGYRAAGNLRGGLGYGGGFRGYRW